MPRPSGSSKAPAPMVVSGGDPDLPFTVDLWNEAGTFPERAVARASDLVLVTAMFTKAITAFPGRVLTLRKGDEIIARHDASA